MTSLPGINRFGSALKVYLSDIVLVVVVAFIAGGRCWAVRGSSERSRSLEDRNPKLEDQGLDLRVTPPVPFWSCQTSICLGVREQVAAVELNFLYLFSGLTSLFLSVALASTH